MYQYNQKKLFCLKGKIMKIYLLFIFLSNCSLIEKELKEKTEPSFDLKVITPEKLKEETTSENNNPDLEYLNTIEADFNKIILKIESSENTHFNTLFVTFFITRTKRIILENVKSRNSKIQELLNLMEKLYQSNQDEILNKFEENRNLIQTLIEDCKSTLVFTK
jgi:hypothetical protein